jgi:hypothetical protein
MNRTLAIAALTAAFATAPLLATDAEAKNGRRGAFAIGAVAGIGGAIIGSAIAKAHYRQHGYGHGYRQHGDGYGFRQHGGGFQHAGYGNRGYHDERDCFRKPIKRFDHYTGEIVVVGSRTVCR